MRFSGDGSRAGKVGHVGDSSNRFGIGGLGDRYRTHHAGRRCTAGDGCGMQRPGGERPAARRDAEYPLARAGCAADGPQAAGYER